MPCSDVLHKAQAKVIGVILLSKHSKGRRSRSPRAAGKRLSLHIIYLLAHTYLSNILLPRKLQLHTFKAHDMLKVELLRVPARSLHNLNIIPTDQSSDGTDNLLLCKDTSRAVTRSTTKGSDTD